MQQVSTLQLYLVWSINKLKYLGLKLLQTWFFPYCTSGSPVSDLELARQLQQQEEEQRRKQEEAQEEREFKKLQVWIKHCCTLFALEWMDRHFVNGKNKHLLIRHLFYI